jgi:hypothetical protein
MRKRRNENFPLIAVLLVSVSQCLLCEWIKDKVSPLLLLLLLLTFPATCVRATLMIRKEFPQRIPFLVFCKFSSLELISGKACSPPFYNRTNSLNSVKIKKVQNPMSGRFQIYVCYCRCCWFLKIILIISFADSSVSIIIIIIVVGSQQQQGMHES